jgi:hypothetical protein
MYLKAKMVRIAVNTLSPASDDTWVYNVEVTENDGGGSQTRYKVTIDKEYYEKTSNSMLLVQKILSEIVPISFEKRKQEFNMREFNMKQIRDYFPEYENEIKKML